MRIAVHEVSKGKKGHALPTTSLEIETGHARFVLAETELRPTVLGLIATGRMRPDTGEVTIDGTRNDRDLRRRMALVDAPEVSDPHPGVTLAAVVGEELMFAGLPATPLHARRWLEQIGFAELATQPIGTIKPSVRVRVMAELAVLRDDVEGFVLVSPDRHGGRPEGWWRIAAEFAERGLPLTMTKLKFFKFIMDEIFPGGMLPKVEDIEKHAGKAGFEITRVQPLRMHYARTLEIWAAALEARKDEAIAIQSQEVYDRYMRYLTGCAELFTEGYTDICQFTITKG